MPGTLQELFSGKQSIGQINPVDQVYLDWFDPGRTMSDYNARPSRPIWAEHHEKFSELMGTEEQDPVVFDRLRWETYDDTGRLYVHHYQISRSGLHGPGKSGRQIWEMGREGEYAGGILDLIDTLIAMGGQEGRPSIEKDYIFHSHWIGRRGGATNKMLLQNRNVPNRNTSGTGSAFDNFALVDVEEMNAVLAPETPDAEKKNWLLGVYRELTNLN